MKSIASRLQSLGITLPEPPKAVAAYVPAVRTGSLVYTAGQIPFSEGRVIRTGPVPSVTSVEEAQAAARQCGLNALAVVAAEVGGDVDRIRRIVRLGVFVQCDPGFTDQPLVANGASELMLEIFGDAGRHARSAVGCVGLPLGSTVEVEMIAEVE